MYAERRRQTPQAMTTMVTPSDAQERRVFRVFGVLGVQRSTRRHSPVYLPPHLDIDTVLSLMLAGHATEHKERDSDITLPSTHVQWLVSVSVGGSGDKHAAGDSRGASLRDRDTAANKTRRPHHHHHHDDTEDEHSTPTKRERDTSGHANGTRPKVVCSLDVCCWRSVYQRRTSDFSSERLSMRRST